MATTETPDTAARAAAVHTDRSRTWGTILYRVALACGGGPLAVGCLIFLLWLVTRDFDLVFFGFLLIFPLLAIIGAGVIAWIAYLVLTLVYPTARGVRNWIHTLEALLLLVVNFPVAFGMMLATVMLTNDLRVTVRNESSEPLEQVTVSSVMHDRVADAIPPGGRETLLVPLDREGPITLRYEAGTTTHEAVVEGYAHSYSGLDGWREVRVGEDGAVTVAISKGPLDAWLHSR